MSQDDQRAKHLDDAETHLRHTSLGTTRYGSALRCLIAHLRSLPSEPKVKPGEGRCRYHATHAGRLLRCVLALGHEGDHDCYPPIQAHPPAALELTDEEREALALALTHLRRNDTAAAYNLAREALRKLNARAGSEGAKAIDGAYARGYRDGLGRQPPANPISPPAASETAKCPTCNGDGVYQSGGRWLHCRDPRCFGAAARPSPENSVRIDATRDASGERVRFCRNCGARISDEASCPACGTASGWYAGGLVARQVERMTSAIPESPTLSKTETAGDDSGDDSVSGRVYRLLQMELQPNTRLSGGTMTPFAFESLHERMNRMVTAEIEAVRAESEQRIRELELEAKKYRVANDLLRPEAVRLREQLATLKAEKEAAGASRAEWIATNDAAHAQAEILLDERNEARAKLEAAEARVRELEASLSNVESIRRWGRGE